MNELIILALALIGATVTWNINRALKARKEISAQNARYNLNEKAAKELGEQREELRIFQSSSRIGSCLWLLRRCRRKLRAHVDSGRWICCTVCAGSDADKFRRSAGRNAKGDHSGTGSTCSIGWLLSFTTWKPARSTSSQAIQLPRSFSLVARAVPLAALLPTVFGRVGTI